MERFIQKYGRLPTEFDPDYLELLQMSKYRIVDVPDLKPSKCANCGSTKNDGRKYIDFGLDIDWFGIVFICGMCLIDIAKNMGLFTRFIEENTRLRESIHNSTALEERGVEIEKTVLHVFEEVKSYFDRLHPTSPDTPADSGPVLEPDPSVSESGTDTAESGTSKSTDVPRSKNVLSLADLLDSPS